MADINKLIPHILKWEGGWADDPTDKGGATMKGITLTTYKSYCKKKGLPTPTKTDLRNISDDRWKDVLKTFFWDQWKADKIKNQNIANMVVDWLWCSGKWGIVYPQRVLKVADDGIVGPKTLDALNSYQDQKELFNLLYESRKQFYNNIVKNNPSQKRFINGWMNRLNSIKYA